MGLMFLLGCICFYPTDFMGWLILGGSFYFIDRMSLDIKIKGTLLLILLIHQLIALYYFSAYTGFIDGIDFTSFNLTAKTIAEDNLFFFGTDAALFSNLLALFYKINSSQLFGQEISVVFFIISCFVFMRIIRYYKLNQYLIPMLFLYALLPASLLWTSVVLREPYEIAFLMLAFECLLYFKSKKITVLTRLLYLSCATLLIFYICLLHKGLFLSLPIFFIVSLILPLKADIDEQISLGSIKPKAMVQYVFIILLPFFLLLGIVGYQSNSNTDMQLKSDIAHTNKKIIYSDKHLTTKMFEGLKTPTIGVYKTLVKYRYGKGDAMTSLLEANTNYDKGTFVPNNIFQFAYMSVHEYAHYAFLPAVLVTGKWSFMNLILSLIYIARFIFFCSSVNFSVIQYKRKVSSPIILLTLYLVVSFIFSLGTVTYGTAMRHNIMTDWILILLGYPLLYNFFNSLFKKDVWRRLQSDVSQSVGG